MAAATHGRLPARAAHGTPGLDLRPPRSWGVAATAQAEFDGIAAGLAAANPEVYKNLRLRLAGFGPPAFEGEDLVIEKIFYAANALFLSCPMMRRRLVPSALRIATSQPRVAAEALVLALPFWITDSLSPATVLYAGLLALLAAVIVGVLPALRLTRLNVQDSLRREEAANASLLCSKRVHPLRRRDDPGPSNGCGSRRCSTWEGYCPCASPAFEGDRPTCQRVTPARTP